MRASSATPRPSTEEHAAKRSGSITTALAPPTVMAGRVTLTVIPLELLLNLVGLNPDSENAPPKGRDLWPDMRSEGGTPPNLINQKNAWRKN